jgi:tRNA dimethylallyltransferase
MKYLITIIGPTAIGKTSLSIALAQHFQCEIISCDSRQFFKEMRIGTAVPSNEELAAAPHHFIQNKSIFENYSVGDFEKEAIAKLNELFKTNDFAILVGGSGLYVDAILKGFDSFPNIDTSVREEVNTKYEQHGISYLQDQLALLDSTYFQKISLENTGPALLREVRKTLSDNFSSGLGTRGETTTLKPASRDGRPAREGVRRRPRAWRRSRSH